MQLTILFAVFVGLMILQTLSIREGFAATSPGTLTQLATSRPVYLLGLVPA
jgi:hypothetical protein